MKNSKRMMAVIAAAGLAMGTLPGVANAQTGSAELGLNLGAALGSAELGLNLGAALGSEAAELPDLEDLPTGSDGLSSGSTDADGDLDLGSLTEGSTGADAPDFGSITEGSTDADGNLDLGSLTEGSTDADGDLDLGSLGSITDSFDSLSAGSTDADGDLDLGSIIAGSTDTEGNIDLGSLSPEAGSLDDIFSGSTDVVDGSVEALNTGSTNLGSGDIVVAPGSGTGSDSETLLTLGSLAAGGIAVGLALQGGVNLPGLPEVNVGLVCNLPQEGIDFLKNSGSMEQDECLPEEQN